MAGKKMIKPFPLPDTNPSFLLLSSQNASLPCKIFNSRDDAFVGLDSLEWLKLEDNSLRTITGEGLFPVSLKVWSKGRVWCHISRCVFSGNRDS